MRDRSFILPYLSHNGDLDKFKSASIMDADHRTFGLVAGIFPAEAVLFEGPQSAVPFRALKGDKASGVFAGARNLADILMR